MMIRLADYVMQFLVEKGLEDIFVITGRGILFLTDALAKNDNLNSVSMHNEQALSYASYAYSKVKNSYGVALVSTGCASTNCVTGVLNAWQDHVPCVFISGNNPSNENVRYTKFPIRTYGSQEADIIPIVASITKYAVMIDDPSKIAFELEKAFYLANEGIKGPVWIDIPLDIQDIRIEESELEQFVHPTYSAIEASSEDIGYLRDAILNSKRPVCVIGNGIKSSNSISVFEDFIEKTKIPVVYSPTAVDVYPSSKELSIGCVSSLGGSREANFCVQNSDLLIVLGCRMPSMITGGIYDKFAYNAKKIIIDIDDNEPYKGNIKYDKVIKADVKQVINELNKIDLKTTSAEWQKKCLHWKDSLSLTNIGYDDTSRVDLYNLTGKLTLALKPNSILITDSGFEELIIPSNVKLLENQKYVHPFMQGSMGFALPALVGASVACKNKNPVVAVIGDGSMMMNLQELQTIAFNDFPVKIIIVNNDMYAVIRKRQKDIFRTRTVGTDPTNGVNSPDWCKIAQCFGFGYIKVENNSELFDKLNSFLSMENAAICEIMALKNQPYLHTSIMKNEKGQFERRPMEDQAPFLSREVFDSEMINND